jgi:hypothetical protein
MQMSALSTGAAGKEFKRSMIEASGNDFRLIGISNFKRRAKMRISPIARSVIALGLFVLLSGISSLQAATAQSAQPIMTPAEHFGFKPGTDRMLFDYEELTSYLQKLDAASPRLKMVEIGKSPLGKPMYIAFISSEENINRLDRLKEIKEPFCLMRVRFFCWLRFPCTRMRSARPRPRP